MRRKVLVARGLSALDGKPFDGWIVETARPAQSKPVLRPLPVPSNPVLSSLIGIGVSTVRNGDGGNGRWGWGDPFIDHFLPGRINIANRAVGGLSRRICISKGYWEATLALIKPDDYVMIRFGQ